MGSNPVAVTYIFDWLEVYELINYFSFLDENISLEKQNIVASTLKLILIKSI